MKYLLNFLLFGNLLTVVLCILNLSLSGDANIDFGNDIKIHISDTGKYIVVDVFLIFIMLTQIYTVTIIKKILRKKYRTRDRIEDQHERLVRVNDSELNQQVGELTN
jgi:hypothetical protein